ncbi:MAG TPA: alpha/beta hydrolase [Gemmatimonadota bacterium]|nr:alpha/beta hydrolase [Gemmatimonadota bacterium]
MKRAGWIFALAAGTVVAAALWEYRARDYRPVFSRGAGELIAVRDSTGIGRARDGKHLTEVTLVSDSGLEVRLRVRAAGGRTGERHPAAILLGGFNTGRKAVDVPERTENLVLASIEYPYYGPDDPTAWDWVWYFPEMRQAILRTPAALLLAAQYLYTRDDVDPERVSIIGVSLGAPFAVAAAATDRRLAGAALLHGGADIQLMTRYAYADVSSPWLVELMAIGLAWVLAPLEPAKYAGQIAPRPVLMVNATGDEMIPLASVRALYDAARQPKRMIWFETRHVALSDPDVVENLMQITLEWMEDRGLR